MNLLRFRKKFAMLLFAALFLPILAACGGGGTTPATPSEAAQAPSEAASAAPSEAPETSPEASAEASEEASAPVSDGPTAGAAQPGVFRYNLGGEPSTADPQVMSFSDEITFAELNYESLMTFNSDLEPIPGAAETMDVSEDGTVYTFTLRENSVYSDGSPLTAEDFEFAWKRLADPELAGNYQFIGCDLIVGYSEYAATTCPNEEGETLTITEVQELDLDALREGVGVNAIDDQTLEIRLEQPTPYFPAIATMWVGAPVRQADVETADDWWYNPETYIGNGPFILTEWDHENRAVWERNPNYNGPNAPQLERIEMAMITEPQVAFEAFQAGELDFVGVVSEFMPTIESDPELSEILYEEAPRYSFYIGYNTRIAPFDDVTVRQAFSYAIDREAYVNEVLGGFGQVAYTFIPPGIPGHIEPGDDPPYAFNPETAQQLLTEAGYPNGEGLPEIRLTYAQNQINQTRFEFLANQFRENLGIEVTLDPVDPNAYSSLFDAPETTPQMFFLGWGPDFPDPQNYYSTVFKTGTSSAARTGFSSPEFDELTVQADRESDPERRLELYNQASDVLLEEAPVTFIYYTQARYLVRPYVTGMLPEDTTPLDPFPGYYNLPEVNVE